MLKIAVVTNHFPSLARPTDGRSVYEILRVISRDSEVQVFVPNAALPSFLKPRDQPAVDLRALAIPPEMKANYYDYSSLPLISRPFNGWMAGRVLLPHVRRFAPDIILSYFLYLCAYAALQIGKNLSVPVVAAGVGSDIHSIGDRFSAMHTRTVLRESDFLVTVSEDLRKRAVVMGALPEKTRTIVNGCDVSVFHVRDRVEARGKVGIETAGEAVVYIGRLDLRKGLRELVEAAASLRSRRPDLHVYLVGEGPAKPLIETAIQSQNATGYIHMVPGCSFDDVAVWMAAADLVTLPSYNEGCPNSILEALACGRPVVATNVGGIPEIMSDECGRLIPPRAPTELAHALESVLARTWDAKAISVRGGRSWETVAAELLNVLESVLSARQKVALVR